jgi:predicted signal transduction protein with EAL and GGDEF domain
VTSIVPAIISMARGLKLRVVGEGVETLDQLSFLQALGCDEAQGYYFSRPVPPAEFAELLTSGMDRGLGVGNRPGRRSDPEGRRPHRRSAFPFTASGLQPPEPPATS